MHAGREEVVLAARVTPKSPPSKGEKVRLAPTGGDVDVFDTGSGERLPA